MSFLQNTCKPEGLGGRIMVEIMNAGHCARVKVGNGAHIRSKECCRAGRGLRRRGESQASAGDVPGGTGEGHRLFNGQRTKIRGAE